MGKVYYQVYANNSDVPSKVAFDEEEPSLGRIRCDSVASPHTLASIKRHISRVEETPELANADLFADISSDAPLKEGNILILGTDCPGLSPDEPMAIVQTPIVQVEIRIQDGRYAIKSPAADIFWNSAARDPTLGRIRGDSVAPPHSLASIKRHISRMEETPELANADLFADISSDAPLKEGNVSILSTDVPGLPVSPHDPMAVVQKPIVQKPLVQVEIRIPDGRYAIKNRAADIFWNSAGRDPITVVFYFYNTQVQVKDNIYFQVRRILPLFKCSKDNSLFRSGTSHMILMVTSP